jgi:26S proteasome regulatory subunit N4
MESMHAPTISSGPTSGHTDGTKAAGLSIAELQSKKDNMEAELRALGSVLESVRLLQLSLIRQANFYRLKHGVDMNTRLTTPDGFPRADLDVAQSKLY